MQVTIHILYQFISYPVQIAYLKSFCKTMHHINICTIDVSIPKSYAKSQNEIFCQNIKTI